jgi:hypothetical protein
MFSRPVGPDWNSVASHLGEVTFPETRAGKVENAPRSMPLDQAVVSPSALPRRSPPQQVLEALQDKDVEEREDGQADEQQGGPRSSRRLAPRPVANGAS